MTSVVLALLLGQEPRPSEAEMFGESQKEAPPNLTQEAAPANPLQVGGQFYLRAQSTALAKQDADDWSFSAPSLLDVYGDARLNPRVRGFVLGRMFYDPTLRVESSMTTTTPSIDAIALPETAGATTGSAPLSSLFGGRTRGPSMALDQLWLRFDIARTVFVTAGKQHARWGTARFWTPTDFLHVRKRNPLDVFDARSGTTMLKLHLPWEDRGWNFYAYAIGEQAEVTSKVGDVAGAARAEIVLGTAEAGLGAVVQRGHKAKLAADLSAGVWDVDLYGEVALRHAGEIDRVTAFHPTGIGDLLNPVESYSPTDRQSGWKPQVTGGFTYSRKYADKDVWILGGEYFYNALGYDDPELYPGLILPRQGPLQDPATFFYLGRHYGALFLGVPAPYGWDLHSFTVSTLGNLSDRSFVTRVDYAYTLLTHVRVELFAAVHYGNDDGEFRFALRFQNIVLRQPALFDIGAALRVSM